MLTPSPASNAHSPRTSTCPRVGAYKPAMIQAARLAEEGRAFDQSDAGIANRPDSVDRAVARRVIDNQHVNVDIRLAQSAPDRAGDVSRAVVAPDEDVRVAHRAACPRRH